MPKQHLDVGIKLPLDTVTQRIGIIGQTGAGKTHLTTVLAEEMLEHNLPVICLDPQGGMHGLRSSRDGKSPGYPIIVLGGDHADAPLEPTAGGVIADWICECRPSCVLDLSNFRKGEQRRFATDFAEQLFVKNRDPLHLVVDEADLFAPQRPLPDHKRMLGAFEDLVRRGRKKGIGVTLATQRPAVVHKDVLTQVALLVSLRLTGPQDRHALEDWIRYNADEEQKQRVLSSLATLPIGTAWFWSPGWLGMLKKAKVRQRRTFDSSATPKVGARRRSPKRAKVDLDALSTRIADTIERAKQNDPAELRRRIKQLEKELAQAQKERTVNDPAEKELLKHRETLKKIGDLVTSLDQSTSKSDQPNRKPKQASPQPLVDRPFRQSRNSDQQHTMVAMAQNGGPRGGLRRIMVVLAQNPQGLTKRQVGVRAQLSSKSGTFGTYLSTARRNGWITGSGTRQADLTLTEAGSLALGHFDPLPTGTELQKYWIQQLPGGAARMLDTLCQAYPESLDAETLGNSSRVGHSSGTFGTYLSRLRTLELISGARDALQASPDLFD